MQAVAQRVGVRAPSLYKRVPSRAALIAAIGEAALDDLARSITPLGEDPDAAAGLRAVAVAYRAFAHANPHAYELLFMNLAPESRPPSTSNAQAAAPLLALAERMVGPERTLEAARLMTAFAHGFVSMELAGQFRFGGDVDEAYRYGVDVLVDALAAGPAPRTAGARVTCLVHPDRRTTPPAGMVGGVGRRRVAGDAAGLGLGDRHFLGRIDVAPEGRPSCAAANLAWRGHVSALRPAINGTPALANSSSMASGVISLSLANVVTPAARSAAANSGPIPSRIVRSSPAATSAAWTAGTAVSTSATTSSGTS